MAGAGKSYQFTIEKRNSFNSLIFGRGIPLEGD
jgi:hypothetical protein